MNPCSPQGGRRMASHLLAAVAGGALLLPITATASAATPPSAYARADAAVVTAANKVVSCRRAADEARACAARETALQAAGLRLSRLQRTTTARTAKATARASSTKRAPTLAAAGTTLKWTKVAGVSSYVVVRRIAGRDDRYSVVTATSTTPAAVPGKTARYGVRTAIVGSAWSSSVAIAYPATPAPQATAGTGSATTVPTTSTTTSTTPAPAPAPGPGPGVPAAFKTGVVLGSATNWELPFAKQLGAKGARMEFDIDTPAADLAASVEAYAKAGIQPLLLAGFQGRTPTVAQAANLASWAAAYGPGGSFWTGKGYPASVAVTKIEFGNESNQSWQYASLASNPSWASTSTYASIAQGYARAFKEAATKIEAANAGVGLLAIGDAPGNWAQWMNNVYAAVPDFSDYVAGWTMHPYGPQARWQPNMDNALAQLAAHKAPTSTPIYVTEYGLSTDNGRCLDDNYGWDKCLTYDQAGSALSASVAAMRARYGSRLAAMFLYQAHDLADAGASGSRESYFGGLTLDGATKGAYTAAIKSLLSA